MQNVTSNTPPFASPSAPSDAIVEIEYTHNIVMTLVWGTHGGVEVFGEEWAKTLCEELIRSKCELMVWHIFSLQVLPNNVRIRLRIWRHQSAESVVAELKSATMPVRNAWTERKGKLRALWTAGYYASTDDPPAEQQIERHLARDRAKRPSNPERRRRVKRAYDQIEQMER